jgi:hypothetical protein
MKKSALVAGCLFAAAMLHGQTGNYEIKRTFVSPNGSVTAVVAAQPSALAHTYPFMYFLGVISNGSFVPFAQLPESLCSREYHGAAWFDDVQPRWIDDRFLIFEDQGGLAIADGANRRILLDHVFMGYAKSPIADVWAAIRFRATARMQERLEDDFQDTLLLIDPMYAATHVGEASESNFVGQLRYARSGGVILAKPVWSDDGSAAVLTWKQGTVTAVRYNTTLRETASTIVDLKVDPESALSTGLNEDLAPVAARILSDPRTFQSASPNPARQTTYSPHDLPIATR